MGHEIEHDYREDPQNIENQWDINCNSIVDKYPDDKNYYKSILDDIFKNGTDIIDAIHYIRTIVTDIYTQAESEYCGKDYIMNDGVNKINAFIRRIAKEISNRTGKSLNSHDLILDFNYGNGNTSQETKITKAEYETQKEHYQELALENFENLYESWAKELIPMDSEVNHEVEVNHEIEVNDDKIKKFSEQIINKIDNNENCGEILAYIYETLHNTFNINDYTGNITNCFLKTYKNYKHEEKDNIYNIFLQTFNKAVKSNKRPKDTNDDIWGIIEKGCVTSFYHNSPTPIDYDDFGLSSHEWDDICEHDDSLMNLLEDVNDNINQGWGRIYTWGSSINYGIIVDFQDLYTLLFQIYSKLQTYRTSNETVNPLPSVAEDQAQETDYFMTPTSIIDACVEGTEQLTTFQNFDQIKHIISQNYEKNKSTINSNISQLETHMDIIFKLDSNPYEHRNEAIFYAIMMGIDIKDNDELDEFIKTIVEYEQGTITQFSDEYAEFSKKMDGIRNSLDREFAKRTLTARYEAAARVAENRRFYESDFIKFDNLHSDQQDQSGLHVASNIRNINTKLDNYGRKSEGDKDEKNPAIMYTAFDITFKNTFNLDNPAVSKLAAQGVDLRDDLSRYRIYDQDNNFFDKDARDKYVTEKLIPIGLTPDEIGELGKAVEGLPNEVEKNYEVLSGNFYADQDSFEKISKIYALGEIIDNIKKLFASNETLSNNNKLSNFMGLKLDENKPADIVGDCLLLKGTINGSETNIKYNLRTGKLYMNSFTQESINPPKITIGNTEPDSEIGNLGDFDDLLKGYEPKASLEIDENHPSNDSQYGVDMNDSNNPENPDSNDTDSNQKAMEKLMENKLFEKLSEMGRIVKEKAGEQSRENDVIIKILKTFNILPDDGKLVRSIEFEGGSNLFTLLESIKNTNSETELDEFSVLVNKLMKYCRLSRGNNNLNPATPDSSFVSISDINEEKTTPEIHSLIEANKAFFSENGEKDRIKNYESHFDDSVKLSFADIIFNNFCYKEASGSHKISVVKATNFVNSIENGIKNMKNDEQDIVALEETLDSLYD